MKQRAFWKLALGLGLMGIPFAGGCFQDSPGETVASSAGALTPSAEPVVYQATPPAEAEAGGDTAALEPPPAALTNLAEAAIQPLSTNQPVPASVSLSPTVAELAKLAASGVDTAVMLVYVTNSLSTFNLTADEIIYLNDLGVPGPVITAMIQRDEVLEDQGKQALLSSSAPVTSLPAPTPAPEEVAPQYTAPPADQYAAEPPPAPPVEDVSYSTFYDSLAPYGTWVDVSGYGPCWRPTVVVLNPGWQPYFDGGHWVYTTCGWYWMSDYSWGWAPFHYGRWFRHSRWGWCWAPGTVWGPAWVSWRYTDAYCGWAPLPPGVYFSFSLGLTWHGHRVHHWDDCGLKSDHYRFVAWRHFDDHRVGHYGVRGHDADNIYRRSVVVNRVTMNNHTVINQGIPRERVALATRHTLRPVTIRAESGTRPAIGRAERLSGHTLTVYRPSIPQRGQTTRTAVGNGSRQVRGSFNAAGDAASAGSAPIAERAPTSSARFNEAPNNQRNGASFSRGPAASVPRYPITPRGSRSEPPTVVNRYQAGQSSATTSGTHRPGQVYAPRTPPAYNRSSGSINGLQQPQSTTRNRAARTWRNADPDNRFNRIQPTARTSESWRPYGGAAYQPPSQSAPQVPRYAPAPTYKVPSRPSPNYSAPRSREAPRYTPTPAPQRSYNGFRSYSRSAPAARPAPSYSRPNPAPSRSAPSRPSYSRPRSAPTRSYSPPRAPTPARQAPSSPSSNSGGGRGGRGGRSR